MVKKRKRRIRIINRNRKEEEKRNRSRPRCILQDGHISKSCRFEEKKGGKENEEREKKSRKNGREKKKRNNKQKSTKRKKLTDASTKRADHLSIDVDIHRALEDDVPIVAFIALLEHWRLTTTTKIIRKRVFSPPWKRRKKKKRKKKKEREKKEEKKKRKKLYKSVQWPGSLWASRWRNETNGMAWTSERQAPASGDHRQCRGLRAHGLWFCKMKKKKYSRKFKKSIKIQFKSFKLWNLQLNVNSKGPDSLVDCSPIEVKKSGG